MPYSILLKNHCPENYNIFTTVAVGEEEKTRKNILQEAIYP
jgi:hypothetical protein